MENLIYRSKGNFTWEAEWQQLYILSEHWQSDLEFYKDDLDFLYHLFDKYFLWLEQKDSLPEMKELTTGVSGEIKECDKLV